MRKYSNNKIRKTILNFKNQNYKIEFLSKEDYKFEKLTSNYLKVIKKLWKHFSIFKNYKSMKR